MILASWVLRSTSVQIPTKSPGHSEMKSPRIPTRCRPGHGASLADNFWHLVAVRSIVRCLAGVRSAQAVAGKIDAMRVVDDAIQDRVRISGIADQFMPFVHGDLAGDDCRSPAAARFEDFEEVVASGGIEEFETPIVENEQLHTAERPQQTRVMAIAAGEREIGEELGNALVEDGAVVATSPMTER